MLKNKMTGHSTVSGKSPYTASKFMKHGIIMTIFKSQTVVVDLTDKKKVLRGGYTMVYGINEGSETATQAKKKAQP